ncbi:MAG: hypothetical protein WCG81_21200 [Candidatus Angelobacter sp.]
MKDRNIPEAGRHLSSRSNPVNRGLEARYSYYRRCHEFRKNGEQCKAPAEKGTQICHAHASQKAMTLRRERERKAVLELAVMEMRKQGKPECKTADLLTDFKGIQVTLAVMAKALIDGRIDCKTAGQMVVHLQTMSKLLWLLNKNNGILPRMNADHADQKELKAKSVKAANAKKDLAANEREKARTLVMEARECGDRGWAHKLPEARAA